MDEIELTGSRIPAADTLADFLSESLSRHDPRQKSLGPAQQAVADRLAAALDGELGDMVRELERVATCRQPAPAFAVNDHLPPFEAFCAGLRQIGETLLPHMAREYAALCQAEGVDTVPLRWILDARSEAFIAYLLQLAEVHGLAFDNGPRQMGVAERLTLHRLTADLHRVASENAGAD